MTTKLVLNRREGVVAAQDIHLNRSVYSKPLVYSVNEDLSTDKAIKFKEDIRLAPKANVSSAFNARVGRIAINHELSHTVIYAFNNVPRVGTSIMAKFPKKIIPNIVIAPNIKYAQNALPNVSTEIIAVCPRYESSAFFSHYYNTIILDNFSDSMSFQPIKFKETFSEPKD